MNNLYMKFYLSLMVFSYSVSINANSEFQQWMQQQSSGVAAQKKEFKEYKDKRDKAFTGFLKSQWKSVDLVKGGVRDNKPKPDVMPIAPPQPSDKLISPLNTPLAKPVVITVPKPVVETLVIIPVVTAGKGKALEINFYGNKLRFYYDVSMQKNMSSTINKDVVSDYWSALSRTNYEGLLKQINEHQASLQLTDWALASMVNNIAVTINNHRKNESTLLSWFLLAKTGYKARIAYSGSTVYLLMPSKNELFEVTYFTFSGKRYYAIDFEGKKQRVGKVFTYDGEYPNTNKEFDMGVTSIVAANKQSDTRHLVFKFEGKPYNVDVKYDEGRVKFFSTYPQLNLKLYFASGVYEITATPLQKQLAAYMDGMGEQKAVNFLLRFVQTSLKYETDEQQFGEENYLFPEETLFYPYSDCEDRAILFAWLVRSLLNLDVVGLDYPGHVATAVAFNEKVKGDNIMYKGKRYVISDPTYINANSGMTMPAFKKFKPKVIAY